MACLTDVLSLLSDGCKLLPPAPEDLVHFKILWVFIFGTNSNHWLLPFLDSGCLVNPREDPHHVMRDLSQIRLRSLNCELQCLGRQSASELY